MAKAIEKIRQFPVRIAVTGFLDDGGLLVAVAEMALAGNRGVSLTIGRPGAAKQSTQQAERQ